MARATTSIFTALTANVLIAATKFISGSITQSTAMISEGVHSLVDTTNQLLLLLGIHQSKKPPDEKRPFGYGKELYFWSFIVSMLIFGLGGGISIYQGITHLQHPHHMERPLWNYIVLAFSFVFEGTSFIVAAREFNKTRGNQSWWSAIRQSKDPSSFMVLFEDGSAVVGLTIVFVCVWLGNRLNNPYLDGVASVMVGLLLTVVSLLVARESRSLLMGEGIASATKQKINTLIEKDPAVTSVIKIFSTYQSPDEVMLLLIVGFQPQLTTKEIDEAIDRLKAVIKKEYPRIRYIIIQPEF